MLGSVLLVHGVAKPLTEQSEVGGQSRGLGGGEGATFGFRGLVRVKGFRLLGLRLFDFLVAEV